MPSTRHSFWRERFIQTDSQGIGPGRLGARKVSEQVSVPLDRAEPVEHYAGFAWNSGTNHSVGLGHGGSRPPGPGSPVATTRDEDAVNEHGTSVPNRRQKQLPLLCLRAVSRNPKM